MKDPSKFVELDVIEGSFFWSNYVTGISFDKEEFALPPIVAFTDTGTSCSYIPSDYYNLVMDYVTERFNSLT